MTSREPRELGAAVRERRGLVESMAIAVVIAVVAIAWGIYFGARIVVFDGVYMLLGLGLSWTSLRVSKAVAAGPTARFPFGRDSLTPFAVAVQGLALLGTLVYAAADAVVIIRDGGSDVVPVAVAIYGAVTAVLSFGISLRLTRSAHGSGLLVAEAAQWRAGAWLSVVMGVGAGIAMLMSGSRFDDGLPYVDPVLVLIAVALLLPVPVSLLRSGVNALLEGAPPAEVQEAVATVVEQVRAQFGLGEPVVRQNKLGAKLYVELDFMVKPGEWDVSEEDEVRRAVIAGLAPLGYDLWPYVELTTDPGLVL